MDRTFFHLHPDMCLLLAQAKYAGRAGFKHGDIEIFLGNT